MALTKTNLGICGMDDCDDCWVDMKVCDRCGRGPLNDSDPDECGEPDCSIADVLAPTSPQPKATARRC